MNVYRIILIHIKYELVAEGAEKILLITSSNLTEAVEKFNKVEPNYPEYEFESIQLLGNVVI